MGLCKISNLKVAVIGAGVAGLATGLLLRQLGCDVTIFEKDKPKKKEGAGIQITSNGLFVLEKLSLGEAVIKGGLKPDKLCLFNEDDLKSIGSLEILNRLKHRYGRSFIALHRSHLIKVLLEKVKTEKIKINFGLEALPLFAQDEQYVSISYNGEKVKKDLIVVADGVSSKWKKIIFNESKERRTSQSAYRFVLSKKNLPSVFLKNNVNLFFGRGRHFVTYPTGLDGKINFVFCKREKGYAANGWREKVTKKQFLDDFELDENLEACFSNVKTVYKWPIIESGIPSSVQKKNVVLVGDAALGMLPYMAQGANKALEDSWVLANCIREYPLDLENALKKYSKKRVKRLQKLDKVSRLNEKVYHLERKMFRWIFFLYLRLIIAFLPSLFFKRLDWIYNYKG